MNTLKKRKSAEQPENLKRFKTDISSLINENEDSFVKQKEPVSHETIALSRKELRKEKRSLKKMRSVAFQQGKKLPTAEILAEKRLTIAKKEEKRKKEKQRSRLKKERRMERKKEEEEEAEMERVMFEKEKMADDNIIKDMEKKLKMNKRKNKSVLPESFLKDGLDYILNVIDSGKENAAMLETDSEEEGSENENINAENSDGSEDEGDEGDNDSGDSNSEDDDVSVNSFIEDEDIVDGNAINEDQNLAKIKNVQNKTKSILVKDKGIDNTQPTGDTKKSVKFISENNEILSIEKLDKTHTKKKQQNKADTILTKRNMEKTDEDDSDSNDVDNETNMNDDNNLEVDDAVDDSDIDVDSSDNDNDSDVNDDDNDNDEDDDDDIIEDVDLDNEVDDDNDVDDDLQEDIYGRVKDAKGNVVKSEAYIPPGRRLALMDKENQNSRDMQIINKLIKGLLNRLSESNLQGICNQIEGMYRQYSRANLTDSLCALIVDTLTAVSQVPDRIIMEQGLLLAVIHYNIGSEIGATFLQLWIKKFHALYNTYDYGEGKQMMNFTSMLCHLYNFKVVHSSLLFDVIKKFIEKFSEKDIELLLLLLKNIGFSLRKDDPISLKEMIISIQTKASDIDPECTENQSRVKFMLDILLAIKNNNMRKIPNYDHSHIEHLQKLLKSYQKSNSSNEMQLRISYDDLMKAEEKGRWWLVGSAWSGVNGFTSEVNDESPKIDTSEFSEDILELARKQRMNTDIRKNIFCIIISSEDFVDAFEKLLHLNLKNQQEREIICVMMDIVMQLKTYNPFYALLTQKFCEYHRRFQMTVQCNLWDKFKIKDFSKLSLSHLSQFVSFLIARKSQSISVFKVIEFSDIDKSIAFFMKTVLKSLLLDYEEDIVKEVFVRIAGSPKLNLLRDGLKIFMNVFLLRDKKLQSELKETLIKRIEIADKALRCGEPDINY